MAYPKGGPVTNKSGTNLSTTNPSGESPAISATDRVPVSPAINTYGTGVSVPSGKVIRSISVYQKAGTDGVYQINVGSSGADAKFFAYGTGVFTFYLNMLTEGAITVTATYYAGSTTDDGTSRIAVNYTN